MAVVAEAGVVSPGGEYLQCDRLTRPMHAKWSVGEKATTTTMDVGSKTERKERKEGKRSMSCKIKERYILGVLMECRERPRRPGDFAISYDED